MANRDTDTDHPQEPSNTRHNRILNRPPPELKRSDAFIRRESGDGDQTELEFPSGPLAMDRDQVYMLPATLVSYAKAGMTAVKIGQLLHRAVYDNDAPLGHLVTTLVDERTPYAEIATTVFLYLDLRGDNGAPLFPDSWVGDKEVRPEPGPYAREV
ncbi:uncharacterized protein BDW47DRAFT_109942 [Aspergillus candidus]|uniref:Uncharacterized protein n=1 Tax=Aspergillus candidus TaxID=41067 RepID=A0A2I2F4X4_ASPCN|nr:hypothetical protein BDW47DRAFT_109942 [Aspergillus candidus]PLB35664.1 hypothetical protein BDW47DRAFT_109942 [Aspergillus candidus]